MKKLLITTVVVSTALALVSAQNSYKEPERKIVRAMPAKMASTSPQGMPEGMPKSEIPRTGDSIIDGKIATLVKEREEKIKAIREEYQAKIKAIIGDKKVLMKEMMASGTRPMMDDMKKKMENEEYRSGSGTPPMMRDEDRKMNASGTSGAPKRSEPREVRPKPVSLFNGLFKSFFGGDARNAQAQEAQN